MSPAGKTIAAGKSTIRVLEEFNPLSIETLRMPVGDNKEIKRSADLYARRAAFAASESRSLLVAVKCQQGLPKEKFGVFKE